MQRPPALTVFGVLNIVFAVLGAFGTAATIAMLSLKPGRVNNPVVALVQENSVFAAWMKISIPLGFLSCALLLVSGIGLLRLSSWARKLSIGYALYAILLASAGLVFNFMFVVSPLMEKAQGKTGPEAASAIGGAFGGAVGGCFGLIYPIVLLIFMLRPRIVAAFEPPGHPPPLPQS